MLQHLGGTNKGSCKNYGYRELSYSKNSYIITSGNSGSKYNNNERCYWAFYAPGQRTMYIRLRQMEVFNFFTIFCTLHTYVHLVIVLNILLFQTWNGGDYFQAFVGTGYGGFYWLYSHTTHTVPWHWYTDTEFLSLFWHSDGHYDLKPGFIAHVYIAGR